MIGIGVLTACALTAAETVQPEGTVRGWGDPNSMHQAPDSTNLVALDAANLHTVALTSEGKVMVWGTSKSSFAAVPQGLTNATAVSAGRYNVVILKADGTVTDLGEFAHLMPADLTNAVGVSAGMRHSLALRADGTVAAWGGGSHDWGALDVPTTLTNAVAVAAGQVFSAAVTVTGQVVGWGHREFYDFNAAEASLTNIVAIDLGPFGHGLALRDDGGVVAFGSNDYGQATVPAGLTNVIAIAAGSEHSMALTAEGQVVAWGKNDQQQATPDTRVLKSFGIAAGSGSAVLTHAPRIIDWSQYTLIGHGDDLLLEAAVTSPVASDNIWKRDGQTIEGQTNTLFFLPDVQLDAEGHYTMVVTNQFGWHESPPMTVNTYERPPRWEHQPDHLGASPGTSASFVAEARGTNPLEYQWFKNGLEIPDANDSTLRFEIVTESDAGEYHLEVRNSFGVLVGEPVYLATTLPVITRHQSAHRQVRTNWNETLSVEVASPLPVTYQWSHDGSALEGATSPDLHLRNITHDAAGIYQVVISNARGSIPAPPVEVYLLPDIPPWPDPGIVVGWGNNFAGQTEVPEDLIDAVAIASGPMHNLALRSDGTVVSWGSPFEIKLHEIPADAVDVVDIGAADGISAAVTREGTIVTWADYGIVNVIEGMNAVTVAVGNHGFIAVSRDGNLIQYPDAEQAPAGLTNIVNVAAGSEYFHALRSDGTVARLRPTIQNTMVEELKGVSGVRQINAAMGLRWDGTLIGYRPGDEFSATGIKSIARGGAIAIKSNGELELFGAFTDLIQPPPGLRASAVSTKGKHAAAITSLPFPQEQPESQTTHVGADVELSVVARSASPLTFQWYYEGTILPDATNAVLSLADMSPRRAGIYHVALENVAGAVNSIPAEILVLGRPELYEEPEDLTPGAGETVLLSVAIASNPPATLQWRFDGQPILGATNSWLTLTNVQTSASGRYSLHAVNDFGQARSREIVVAVQEQAPAINRLPDVVVEDGAVAELTAEVTGSAPLTFDWFFQESRIEGASGPVLLITNAQSIDAGEYTLQVANDLGGAHASATLTTTPRAVAFKAAGSWQLAWEGDVITLAPEVRGTTPVEFQWFAGDQPLVDATNSVLTITALPGEQHYRLEARNALGDGGVHDALILAQARPVPGRLVMWGDLAAPPDTGLASSAALGRRHWIALLPDKTIVGGGANDHQQAVPPPGLSKIIQVAAGDDFSLALHTDGTVTGWGKNDYGQASPPDGLTEVISISAGSIHAAALRRDGSVVCWGREEFIEVPVEATNLVAIDAGALHTLALNSEGEVFAWGSERFAPAYVPSEITNIVGIAAGSDLNVAVGAGGEVMAWQYEVLPRPEDLPAPATISTWGGTVIELAPDHSINHWGSSNFPQLPDSLRQAFLLEFNYESALAITPQPLVEQTGPAVVTVELGASFKLSVKAEGTAHLGYRWRHEDKLVEGATGPELVVESFEPEFAGRYVAEVFSSYGATSSDAFLVEQALAPSIVDSPAGQLALAGTNVLFSVVATGTPLLQYQWSLNHTNLLHETNAVLALDAVSLVDEGQIRVRVWNEYGAAISPPVELRVSRPAVNPSRLGRMLVDGNQLHFEIHLEPGRSYRLQSSTNLHHWRNDRVILSPDTPLEVYLEQDRSTAKFYRMISP